MLNIKEIETYYPDYLRSFKRNIYREYLQYKILDSIFHSEIAHLLSFIGGTALRIVYANTRFSEDLDFDNFGIHQKDFQNLSLVVKKNLELEGYEVEIKNVYKGAFRCKIKIPKVLFKNNLSPIPEEKILIQIDTEPLAFDFLPEKKILNKFDIFTQVFVTPLDLLLAQKFFAVFNRKRPKGRDFFDILFLLSKTKPNYHFLDQKLGIKNQPQLKKKLLSFCKKIDFPILVKDIQPFLFYPSDSKKILLFTDYIAQEL